MAKKLFWLFLLLASPGLTWAQGSRFDSSAQRTVQGLLAPIPGATVVVCTSAGTGTPCSPVAPIYLDAGLTQQITGSVITADANGNFGWWAAPGTYTYSITATGVTGKLFTVVLPINLASNNTLTGSNTFSQQIVSTVSTGTAPFSIASTTVTPNLNAQLHNGLSAPATGAIAGVVTGNSAPTNFGTALSTQTIVASVPSTGTFAILFSVVQSLAGATCSAVSNSVSPTINFTGPGGTAESISASALNMTGNGVLDQDFREGVFLKVLLRLARIEQDMGTFVAEWQAAGGGE